MSYGGSGSSGGSIATGADVALSNPANGQVLTYASSTGKWTNQTVSSSGGSSTTGITRVVKNTDNTWPARPSGATFVEWVGPGSPDPPYTTSGDTWVDTTP